MAKTNDPVRLRAERWQMRSAAVGGLLLGTLNLAAGLCIDRYVARNPPTIDRSSLFNYMVTSHPHALARTYEAAGALGLVGGAIAAYKSRRITHQLRG